MYALLQLFARKQSPNKAYRPQNYEHMNFINLVYNTR